MKNLRRYLAFAALLAGATFFLPSYNTAAAEECVGDGTRFSVSPTAKNLNIKPGELTTDSFELKNLSTEAAKFKIYAEPYSNTGDDKNFSTETTFTQMSRWIDFLDASGGRVKTLEISVPGCTTREITFRVVAPASVPAGGQYAAIFAESSNGMSDATISTSSRVGVLLYARMSEGQTVLSSSLAEPMLDRGNGLRGNDGKLLKSSVIYGTVKVTNDGNIDTNVESTLVVRTILGREVYKNTSSISILPGTFERKITDIWEETPTFGLFTAEYSVKTGTGASETITRTFLILPLPLLLILAAALVVVVIGIISFIRKVHKKRQNHSWRRLD